jgi:preprotein translocase subunit SecG
MSAPCVLASRPPARPGNERRSAKRSWGRWYPGPVLAALAVFHVLVSIALIGLILMHSGRDTGLGGMGFTPASQGGTHIVERNLTRLTVLVGLIFLADTIGLFHLLK